VGFSSDDNKGLTLLWLAVSVIKTGSAGNPIINNR